MTKKGAVSFESIAATIGAILIGTGVAWFVAQNWHQMPSALKIIILLFSTGASYAGGTVLRVRGYPLVSKALFILGALLYTLSIFLIAQIFFTGGSVQGIAWLFMISFLGVFAAAYFLESEEAFGIGAIEFVIWAAVQAFAFMGLQGPGTEGRISIIIPFAITGILLGISALSLVAGNKLAKSIGVFAAIAIFISIVASTIVGIFGVLVILPLIFLALLVRSPKSMEGRISLCKGLLSSTIIFWLALILNLPLTLQAGVAVVFLAAIVALWIGYAATSEGTVFLAMAELTAAVVLQFLAFAKGSSVAPAILAINLLELGAMFYGLSLVHRARGHEFGKVYSWWTAFYFLLFAYILSFQATLPAMWSMETKTSMPAIFSAILGIAAAISIAAGLKTPGREEKISGKETAGVLALILLLASVIAASSLISNTMGTCYVKGCYEFKTQSSCEGAPERISCTWNNYCTNKDYSVHNQNSKFCNTYNNNNEACLRQNICNWRSDSLARAKTGEVPWSVLGIWIFSNIVFIAVILGAIGYGTQQRTSGMINLGIVFFALDILTRYAGFISDYWGYTSLSIIFISGGIILIGGGVLVERWRKRLVTQAKDNTSA